MIPKLITTYREHQLAVTAVLGIPLALGFVAASVIVSVVLGLAGSRVITVLQVQLLLGILLWPVALSVIIAIRWRLPPLSGDAVLFWLMSALTVIVVGRLFNVGITNPWLIYGVLLLLTLSLAVTSAVGMVDAIRFRTPRLGAVIVVTFIALLVPFPHVGFALSQGCLADHKDSVLSGHEFDDGARCGPIAWRQSLEAKRHGEFWTSWISCSMI